MKKMASERGGNGGEKSLKAKRPDVSLLLHDIRSIHNVGSIFRTADAFGVKKIFLSGYTPAPVDRFGRKRADIAKVALGAENSVAWERLETALECIRKFKKETEGIVIALEQDSRSADYRQISDSADDSQESPRGSPRVGSLKAKNSKILLILGNEVGGISRDILDMADIIAEIPMHGAKESLNVSVAAGIALFGMFG